MIVSVLFDINMAKDINTTISFFHLEKKLYFICRKNMKPKQIVVVPS